MKISIIIPIYFYNEFVENLLISIKNQSSKNFEVVFVGNNISLMEFEEIQANINRVLGGSHIETQYHFTTEQGANASRKIGLAKSKYEYVTFLDCDDCFAYHDVIKDMVNIAEAHQPDVISSNIQRAGLIDGQIILRDIIYSYKSTDTLLSYDANEWTIIENFGTNIVARVIKKSCIQDIEFSMLPFFQDWNISSKIFPSFSTFYFFEKPTYLYVSRNDSISQFHSQSRESLLQAFNCIKDIDRYYKANGYNTSRYKFLYDKVLRFCVAYINRSSYLDINEGMKVCKTFLKENNYGLKPWVLMHPKLLMIYCSIQYRQVYKAIFKK